MDADCRSQANDNLYIVPSHPVAVASAMGRILVVVLALGWTANAAVVGTYEKFDELYPLSLFPMFGAGAPDKVQQYTVDGIWSDGTHITLPAHASFSADRDLDDAGGTQMFDAIWKSARRGCDGVVFRQADLQACGGDPFEPWPTYWRIPAGLRDAWNSTLAERAGESSPPDEIRVTRITTDLVDPDRPTTEHIFLRIASDDPWARTLAPDAEGAAA